MNKNTNKTSIPMTNTTWIDEFGETLEVSYLAGTPSGESRIYIEMTRAASKPGEICDFIDVAMTRSQIRELIATLLETLEETNGEA